MSGITAEMWGNYAIKLLYRSIGERKHSFTSNMLIRYPVGEIGVVFAFFSAFYRPY